MKTRIMIAVMTVAGSLASQGQQLVIQSFDHNGSLTFNELATATNYHLQWASSVVGPWTNCSAFASRDVIPPTGTGTVTVTVPMFYRVVADLPPWSLMYFRSDQSGCMNIWRAEVLPGCITNRAQITFYTDHNVQGYALHRPTGKIVFALTPTNDFHGTLYTMDCDGRNIQMIPNQPSQGVGGLTWWPVAWSPDGERIVFTLSAPDRYDANLTVATIKPDGSDYQVLMTSTQPRGQATHKDSFYWTDAGLYFGDTLQWAAYATDHEIFRYSGGGFTNLTQTDSVGERAPVVSPDGLSMVFETPATDDLKSGISLMSVNGGSQTVLIPRTNYVYSVFPSDWPLADQIFYVGPGAGGTSDIYRMKPDGTGQTNLTATSSCNEFDPVLR
jgi:hypothetical protein